MWDGFWEEVEMQEDGVSEAAILMERAGDLFEAILYMLSIFDFHDTWLWLLNGDWQGLVASYGLGEQNTQTIIKYAQQLYENKVKY